MLDRSDWLTIQVTINRRVHWANTRNMQRYTMFDNILEICHKTWTIYEINGNISILSFYIDIVLTLFVFYCFYEEIYLELN